MRRDSLGGFMFIYGASLVGIIAAIIALSFIASFAADALSGRAPTHSLPSDCHVERPME